MEDVRVTLQGDELVHAYPEHSMQKYIKVMYIGRTACGRKFYFEAAQLLMPWSEPRLKEMLGPGVVTCMACAIDAHA